MKETNVQPVQAQTPGRQEYSKSEKVNEDVFLAVINSPDVGSQTDSGDIGKILNRIFVVSDRISIQHKATKWKVGARSRIHGIKSVKVSKDSLEHALYSAMVELLERQNEHVNS